MLIALAAAGDESRYGGKAAQLAAALGYGLPVPAGFALDDAGARRVLEHGSSAELERALDELGGLCAVRSSAVGEDSASASFAGQHATVLGVRTCSALLDAIAEVLRSAESDAALAYRKKLGLDLQVRIGVVVQQLVCADVAGVLFTRHPLTSADERVIEASFGLGEAVVQGLVTPDRFRVERGGRVLERTLGDKDLAIRWADTGGTEEVAIEPERACELCLDDAMLTDLEQLASRCENAFGGSQDLEFAFEGRRLFLLQRRAITRG